LEYEGIKLIAKNESGKLTFPTQFPDWKPISMAEAASNNPPPHEYLKERFLDRLTFITKWDKDITDNIEQKKAHVQEFIIAAADPKTTYWQEFFIKTAAEDSTFWQDMVLEAMDAVKTYWQELITNAVSAEKTFGKEFGITGYRPGIDFIQDFSFEAASSSATFFQELHLEAVDAQKTFCKDVLLDTAGKESTYNKEFLVTLHTLDIFYLTEFSLTGYETEVIRSATIPAKQLVNYTKEITLEATKNYFEDFLLMAKSPNYTKNFRIEVQGTATQPPPPPKTFEIVIVRIDPATPLPSGFFVTVRASSTADDLITGKQFSDINTSTVQILNELGAATYNEITLTIPQSAFTAGAYVYPLYNTGTFKTVALVHSQLILENF
jgi:hypothetical protein